MPKSSEEHAFEVLNEAVAYDGFFNLTTLTVRHTLFGGGWSPPLRRELFQRGDCVGVVLYDPSRDSVVLLEQFRVGAVRHSGSPWLIEIVAGAVEPGEHPDAVARREAREEAGCEIRRLIPIFDFYTSPGGSSERIALYCGLVDSTDLGGVCGLAEEHEDIRVAVVPFASAMEWLQTGRINSAVPLIGLYWLAANRERLRSEESAQ